VCVTDEVSIDTACTGLCRGLFTTLGEIILLVDRLSICIPKTFKNVEDLLAHVYIIIKIVPVSV
jgi:hypothetical protein